MTTKLPGLSEVRELVKATFAAVGAGGVAVAGIAGVAGAAGAVLAVAPVGAALGVAAVLFGVRAVRRKSERVAARRETLRQQLDTLAETRIDALGQVCEETATKLILNYSTAIDTQMNRLRAEIAVARSQYAAERPRSETLARMDALSTRMLTA